jgi:hypothetical protein
MPDQPPESDDGQEILVTGRRPQEDEPGISAEQFASLLQLVQPLPNLFDQTGGGSTAVSVSISLINGNLVVRLPGYNFPIKVPAATWEHLNEAQKGALVKLFTEYSQSPELVQFLDHLKNQGVSEVEINYDTKAHNLDGTVTSFQPSTSPENVKYSVVDLAHQTDLVEGTKVIITIDRSKVSTANEFIELVIHALGHPLHGNSDAAEEYLRQREGIIYDQIFHTHGEHETSPTDYYNGMTVAGSMYNDNVTGGTGNDTLAGLSGNDILNGGLGNDLVMGGAGMDQLSGGLGDNMLVGGLDADTYLPTPGAGTDYIVEMGGVDRIDLSSYYSEECVFSRNGNSLNIVLPDGGIVIIEDQWLAGKKVEQFTFAESTYASSYVEYMATHHSPGPIIEEGGEPIMSGPFGLPVVFDLDGDGIELRSLHRSKVRFDINGDGQLDHLGWVGKDDGLLALDRNGNGRIDSFSEISFARDFKGAGSDLEGLYAYDSNGDGYLTHADDRFGDFMIWRDTNGDGKSRPRELFTLDELGIVSISLERTNISELQSAHESNQVLATSTFQTASGVTRMIGDIALFGDMGGLDHGSHAIISSGSSSVVIPSPNFEGLIP